MKGINAGYNPIKEEMEDDELMDELNLRRNKNEKPGYLSLEVR